MPTLVQEVADWISTDIENGKLAPGAQLPTEKEMIEALDVSRTVIREAVAQLRAEGLVTTRQGLGAFVAEDALLRPLRIDPADVTDLKDLVQLTELRLAIEAEAAAMAAMRADKAGHARMAEALEAIDTAVHSGDHGAAADFAFHCAMVETAGNPHFLRVLQFLGQYIIPRKSVDSYAAAREKYLEQLQAEHRAIYQAIVDRNPEEARAAVRRHLGGSRDRLALISDDKAVSAG